MTKAYQKSKQPNKRFATEAGVKPTAALGLPLLFLKEREDLQPLYSISALS